MKLRLGGGSAAERWFRSRGLTSLLRGTGEDSSAGVRGAPVLVVLFLLVMLWAVPDLLDISWPVGFLVSVMTILLTWAGANLARRRPMLSRVSRIGSIEALAFVGVPTAVVFLAPRGDTMVEGMVLDADTGRVMAALVAMAIQSLLLLLVLGLLVTGTASLLSLLAREVGGAMSRTSGALAAVIPVMLGFVFFFFLNTGVWGGIATLDGVSFAALVTFLLLLGAGFLGNKRQFDPQPLARFETRDELDQALAATAFGQLASLVTVPAQCPLDRRQRFALRGVFVLSRLVTALVLATSVFAVFVVLGFIVIGPETVQAWTKTAPEVLVSVTVAGHVHVVCWQIIRVAGFLATFSAFNYTLVAATDGRLRQDATDAATHIIRQACALRLALLSRVGRPTVRDLD